MGFEEDRVGSESAAVLIFTCVKWPATALLADALIGSGLKVAALAPGGHPLSTLRDVQHHRFSPIAAHAILARTIEAVRPQIIIPGDDSAVCFLQDHHSRFLEDDGAQDRVALIERSLGDPRFFEIVRRKSAFVAFAAQHGLPIPPSQSLANADEAASVSAAWPKVIKADGWESGRGVVVVQDAQEAAAAYRHLTKTASLWSVLREAMHVELLLPLYRRALYGTQAIIIQSFAKGNPVNRAVVCSEGRILAGRTLEAVETMPGNGNATVVRVRDIPAVDAVVERCVALLGLSGVIGFDFMYDDASGELRLLELNARATAACYLAAPGSRPIVEVLAGHREIDQPEHSSGLIALFPQEIHRDPASPYLTDRSVHHMPPWHRPELVVACIQSARRISPFKRLTLAVKRVTARFARRRMAWRGALTTG